MAAMRRVVIMGPGGAGKSTLARTLGERTGLPVFHLDQYFWHRADFVGPRTLADIGEALYRVWGGGAAEWH